MLVPSRAIDPARAPTLIGAVPGALLAGATVLLALRDQGITPALSTLGEDPLTPALSRALAARGLPSAITRATLAEPGAIVIGNGALLDDARVLERLPDDAWLAITGVGSEPCDGHDAERAPAQLAACLADGSLEARTQIAPFDPIARAWLELVEDVHHAVGPARQIPIVDAIRAALLGRTGRIAVDLAARERPAHVSIETASIAWIRPPRR